MTWELGRCSDMVARGRENPRSSGGRLRHSAADREHEATATLGTVFANAVGRDPRHPELLLAAPEPGVLYRKHLRLGSRRPESTGQDGALTGSLC